CCSVYDCVILCTSCSLIYHILFLHATPTPDLYTLSLHDALPIWTSVAPSRSAALLAPSTSPTLASRPSPAPSAAAARSSRPETRSEEHTSELQSQSNLVCRLLLEKKKIITIATLSPLITPPH